MSDALYELLRPHLTNSNAGSNSIEADTTTSNYLTRLTTLPLTALTTTEPQSLTQNTQSHLHALQSLSQRSHTQIIKSHTYLANLQTNLPSIATSTALLKDQIPYLDQAVLKFQETYNKSSSNPLLETRREALLLSRNVDRLQDILDLPTLLATAISSSTSSIGNIGTTNANSSYATALDLYAHIKRLSLLFPESKLVREVQGQATIAMQQMSNNLIASLRAPTLKLAGAMRTISWIRRVTPDLVGPVSIHTPQGGNNEGALGALFLMCRLGNLNLMLSTLEPLKELADQETTRRLSVQITSNDIVQEKKHSWAGGQQTERYLKRYIEIFREQSFSIISMFKSIFPVEASVGMESHDVSDPLLPIPSALSTFPLHLVTMLHGTLKYYLPNVQDKSSRDSLLTQVLYCAGSLGRLGGDFSMILSMLGDADDEDDEEQENRPVTGIAESATTEDWMHIMKKHRTLAGKLEGLVGAKS